MSAWPEAVWAVKKIEQDLNLNPQILNNLSIKIDEIQEGVSEIKDMINSKPSVIRAKSIESITQPYSKGTACLIVDEL